MAHIVLTEEQARVVGEASKTVDVHDAEGRVVAIMERLHPQEIEAIVRLRQRRANGVTERGIPGARIQAMLRKFQEIKDREGEITTEQVQAIVERVKAGEEP